MSFKNPITKRVEEYEKKLNIQTTNNDEIEVLNDNINDEIISLNTILSDTQNFISEERPTIEFIEFAKVSKIVNVPRSISLSPKDIGVLSVKYDNQVSSMSLK